MHSMKNKLYLLCWLMGAVLAVTACADREYSDRETDTAHAPVSVRAEAVIAATHRTDTRGVDPDGIDIRILHAFCFDARGGFICRREATADGDTRTELTGTGFRVEVPANTRIIHFLANMYDDEFEALPGADECSLIPSMKTASGRMVYWGRKAFASADELASFAEGGQIQLFASQAKVTRKIEGTAAEKGVKVFGYALCNCPAWGTVAPFRMQAGTDGDSRGSFDFDLSHPYQTFPGQEYRTYAKNPEDVCTHGDTPEGDPHYTFEHPNTFDFPLVAVMRIGTDETTARFYKIMFVDDRKELLPIYRNYEYVIHIKDLPENAGYATFREAYEGVAANNAWVSIDPAIPEISDGTNTLSVKGGTTRIFTSEGEQTIDFTYTGSTDGDVRVKWLDNADGIASAEPELVQLANGAWQIKIKLNRPQSNPLDGTLLLSAGIFSRRIKVYLMQPMEFTPLVCSGGVPLKKGELMVLSFTIPDNFPEELLPLTCKVATNKMNAADSRGQRLPVIAEDCVFSIRQTDGTVKEVKTGWGYKFTYQADRTGMHEIYFSLNTGTDNPNTDECGVTEQHCHLFLEAGNFNTAEKIIRFQPAETTQRYIRLDGVTEGDLQSHIRNIPPTANQPVALTVNFLEGTQAATPKENSVMTLSTTALIPDFETYPAEKAQYLNDGQAQTDGGRRFYTLRPTASTLTLHMKTRTAQVEDLIQFALDNDLGLNTDPSSWYKSASVRLEPSPTAFSLHASLDEATIPYGENVPVYLNFDLPEEAVKYTDVKFYLRTQHLKPDPESPYTALLEKIDRGYAVTIPRGSVIIGQVHKFRFLTTRIASAEQIEIGTVHNTEALFEPFGISYQNSRTPCRIQLPTAVTSNGGSPFITLERRDGTRLGVFHLTQEADPQRIAAYALELRPEYNFGMDEPLVIYLAGQTEVYVCSATFRQILDSGNTGKVFVMTARTPGG